MKRQQPDSLEKQGLNAQEFQLLVDELMKDHPDQAKVRKLMQKQGLAYTQDPIAQMSLVLKSMGDQGRKPKDSISL